MHEILLQKTLSKFKMLRVGVVGDFALDVYYQVKKKTGEISVETGLPVFYGKSIKTSPGGAGNVVLNLHALGSRNIKIFGIAGHDLHGREMLNHFKKIKVDCSALQQSVKWDTCTYIKPLIRGIEDNRLDFGSGNKTEVIDRKTLIRQIKTQLSTLDLLIINRQFIKPVVDDHMLMEIKDLAANYPNCFFIADLRESGSLVKGYTLKINVSEAAKILKCDPVKESDQAGCVQLASSLNEKLNSQILLTRGGYGMIHSANNKTTVESGISLSGKIDAVGAGDTVIAAFGMSMAAKSGVDESLRIANLSAGITVQKLKQTGTANPKEIIGLNRKLI